MPSDAEHSPSPSTVAITGATGLIGSALVDRLRGRGHIVRRIVRSAATPGDALWDPAHDLIDARALVGVDAVVNLAGEPIARRWTAERKAAIRESRLRGTALLARSVTALPVKPRVFLSGSAIGYYGDRGDELLDETARPGDGFLARLTVDWEAATAPISDAGVRVVLLRTGVVLSPNGGALEKLLPIFRLGGGGPIGSGTQWMSWISLDDQVRAIEHALFAEKLRGAANLTAPEPVRNAEFATTLGRVLGRPALLPVPAFALELLYGEMARETLLAGQRVVPAALASTGFRFGEPTLEGALRCVLRP
ncbi:MAG: TIGR01777 family oxidoreductase [Gemmatimonadaceae bacterium]